MSIIPSVQVNQHDTKWINGQKPSPDLRNKCFFVLLKEDDNINFTTARELIMNMSKILVARPKLVLTLTENDDQMTNLETDESILFPWIVLTNHRKVAITCPGCGTTHHGLWRQDISDRARGIGSFTKNLQQPLCCDKIRGRKIRISYNYKVSFWDMKNSNQIDTGTIEGNLMNTFIVKNKLVPEYINANFKWGSLDKETNLWNGGVGNVS